MSAVSDIHSRDGNAVRFVALLLATSLVMALFSLWQLYDAYPGSDSLLAGPHHPFGADFVNLWTTGRLLLDGRWHEIYDADAFMAFQQSFIREDIGHRIWAYPAHSLLFAWPAGLGSYYLVFCAWTILGLAVLAAGARRFGFDWAETGVLLLSPAALACVTYGQTGNLACGLLLMALAGTRQERFSASSAIAAAVLTIKPQSGFLLPLFWLFRRQWLAIVVTGVLTFVLVGLSIAIFGVAPWRDYFGDTLPELSELERYGGGPFLYMIPSTFISMRLLGYEAGTASAVHFVFAGAVLLFLLWSLWRETDRIRQAAMVLIATCLITPYQHIYDLTILMAGALLMLRGAESLSQGRRLIVLASVAIGWVMPKLVGYLGVSGFPISPILILGMLIVLVFLPRAGRTTEHT